MLTIIWISPAEFDVEKTATWEENALVRACINDVLKIKIGKNQNQNWASIGRGLKPPDYASLFF